MLNVKDVIDNRYEIREKLGEGLYQAADNRLMTNWLVREIKWHEAEEVDGLLSVLEGMRKSNHRLFPKIVEVVREESRILVVMENISGRRASELEKEKRRPEIILNQALDLCEGLHYFSSLECGGRVEWELDAETVIIDGGRVRLRGFHIVGEKDMQEERDAVLAYAREMLGQQGKGIKKLSKGMEKFLQGQTRYSDYPEMTEGLERVLLEYNQSKKLRRVFLKAGAAVAILGCAGLAGWEAFSVMRGAGDGKAIASPSESTGIEPSYVPEHTPKTAKPTKEPTPAPTLKATKEPTPELTAEPTSSPTPKPTVRPTKSPMGRTEPPASPASQPTNQGTSVSASRQPGQTKKPPKAQPTRTPARETEKPKKPDTMEIDIEDESNMEIQIRN